MTDWQEIKDAPIGETILLSNAESKITTVGYGEWSDKLPFPIFNACDPMGFGRFKATHWAPLPEPAQTDAQRKLQSENAA